MIEDWAALPDDDTHLTPEAIERCCTLKIAERDELGRLLPGSQFDGKGKKPGVMITTMARQHTETAIRVLTQIMEDPKAPPAARATAARALLDRGWGKAPVQIDVQYRANFADFLRDVGIAARLEHIDSEAE